MVAIFVVLTILGFILIEIIINKFSSKTNNIPVQVKTKPVDSFRVPRGLFFYPGHTWASVLPSGKVTVGVDDFVHKIIGKVDEIKFRDIGDKVKQGQPMFELRQSNRILQFSAPVDGVVKKVNSQLLQNIQMMRDHPYSIGWLYQIEPNHLSMNLSRLLIGEKSVAWFRAEITRFKDFIQSMSTMPNGLGQTLQDGGIPANGLLEQMDDKTWTKFEDNFLRR